MTDPISVLRRGLSVLDLDLPSAAIHTLAAYADLLRDTNARHNLIARTDLDAVEERHILHCLELARWPVADGSVVVDWGTGGGLPLIPLAVAFPGAQFVGVDSVEKKVMSVRRFARELGVGNATAIHTRAEEARIQRTSSVSRATAPLEALWRWHVAQPDAGDATRMLRCLKGGDLTSEIADLHSAFPDLEVEQTSLRLNTPWARDKCAVAVWPVAAM